MGTMQIVLVLFMAATLAVVVIGVIAMAVNGKLNKNHSNKNHLFLSPSASLSKLRGINIKRE